MRVQRGRSPLAHRVRAGLVLASTLVLGSCGAQQRAAESLIDPQLLHHGVMVERQRGVRDLELGRYRVVAHTLTDLAFDDDGGGALGPDANGRTRPGAQVQMSFTLVGGVDDWSARCVGRRRQPPDSDFAAIADELRDEVALHCELSGGEQRWVLELEGDLGANLDGRLYPAGEPSADKRVELILWRRLWNITRRRLPATLACIRSGETTEAALILDTPERAWLDPKLDDSTRELELTALLALRLIPLGFDG